MTKDKLSELLETAFEQMGERKGPRQLERKIVNVAEEDDVDLSSAELGAISERLTSRDENDSVRLSMAKWLRRWDHVDGASWTQNSSPNTQERRDLVYEQLGLTESQREFFTDTVEKEPISPILVIGRMVDHDYWYDGDRQQQSFYWKYYREFLLEKKDWPLASVESLSQSSRAVVARLRDPDEIAKKGQAGNDGLATRGLVVGYVQSGKTANFTAVIARAIDAGYRIIIVMTGTIEILRKQTVRRLDKELLGTEALPEDERTRYATDEDFGEFVSYGSKLEEPGATKIFRMGLLNRDYATSPHNRLLETAFAVDPSRVKDQPTLLFVVKKNSIVLAKLNRDLELAHATLRNVPAILIDDESDQAGIDTREIKKKREEDVERNATNREIVRLLRLLPHCQYIGYTATPFANVFVDPDDLEDIFPRDYIVPLPRPEGYVGVSDFYDLDEDNRPVPDEICPTGKLSNREAFYRAVIDPALSSKDEGDAQDSEPEGIEILPRLEEAVDAFVLSGAIKSFRERQGGVKFRHHTMLVHTSSSQKDHREVARQIREIWDSSNYGSGAALERLRRLWEDDFFRVSQERWRAGLLKGDPLMRADLIPKRFEDLEPSISDCRQRIGKTIDALRATIAERIRRGSPDDDDEEAGEDDYSRAAEILPVVVVNSDREFRDLKLDFDRQPVWAVLCGGTKLSRGFTVEGLTISYYRRKAAQADTLMQMGRWFGFRPAYGDLVRLYLGIEQHGKTGRINLYEEFGALCMDEETLRERLAKYSVAGVEEAGLERGDPRWTGRLTPGQVAPLVSSHSRFLRPTARNKMWNAHPEFQNLGGDWQEKIILPDGKEQGLEREDSQRNLNRFEELLSGRAAPFSYAIEYISKDKTGKEKRQSTSGEMYSAEITPIEFRDLISNFRFRQSESEAKSERPYVDLLEFVGGTGQRDPGIERWLILVPQPESPTTKRKWNFDGQSLKVFVRNRISDGGTPTPPFKAFSEARHRRVAEYLAGVGDLARVDDALEARRKSKTGVLLLYPSIETSATDDNDCPLSMGHAILCPNNDIPQRIVYRVLDAAQRERAAIERVGRID